MGYLLVQLVQSEVQGLLHVLLPVLVGELDVATPRNNGDKLAIHALALKGLNGNHLHVMEERDKFTSILQASFPGLPHFLFFGLR